MKISVLIPVYNERHTIEQVLLDVEKVPVEKEIIVIDDGSTDGTRQLLENIHRNKKNHFKVIFLEKNRGKGYAIRCGLKEAKNDFVIIQDADLELNPNDYLKLINAIKTENCQVVYGSRFLGKTNTSLPLLSILANKFLTSFTNLVFNAKLSDMETCYKLCPRKLLQSLNLTSERFEIEPEITCKILKQGYKIKEIPISYSPRKKGKKIGWKDGFKAIFSILKYRIIK
ncbi:MAG TPA: glycosyltransferase family 2 protein [Candidatus Ratteibacteria bacterium]|uniref:Undecaprenyl-phosphate 4-deoxy-4-formamido-L-arabinose transferase n=1 Tax=candidate division TA06 bacterium ADurb.Bin131 TaxID=1852827 RepID=A0A1V6C4F8_UNCT6|nr:MAG: Undecaprenyl-phosphate 4-deoxy-4-formamido-L-arabinose transferase [candidate division TA06 bacterium ADurb.Bin131]HON04830.1 glycosyltransferase family 2 protein [bacterium]HRS06185.1 glycosyltransferase family 2 protein [Candidatus Ratteibacteria bacterium]HRV03668.1 glycosyltransferase family 2 protein [Candidatus Ratteibacteria bacterium]